MAALEAIKKIERLDASHASPAISDTLQGWTRTLEESLAQYPEHGSPSRQAIRDLFARVCPQLVDLLLLLVGNSLAIGQAGLGAIPRLTGFTGPLDADVLRANIATVRIAAGSARGFVEIAEELTRGWMGLQTALDEAS